MYGNPLSCEGWGLGTRTNKSLAGLQLSVHARYLFSLAIHYPSYHTYQSEAICKQIILPSDTDPTFGFALQSYSSTAFQNNAVRGEMALMEALNTASVVYSDGLSQRSSCYDYCSGSLECPPEHSPGHRSLDHSNRLIMNDKDKGIYNSLGSSSSPHGKVRGSDK